MNQKLCVIQFFDKNYQVSARQASVMFQAQMGWTIKDFLEAAYLQMKPNLRDPKGQEKLENLTVTVSSFSLSWRFQGELNKPLANKIHSTCTLVTGDARFEAYSLGKQ